MASSDTGESSNENVNTSASQVAQKMWEMANDMTCISSVDDIYRYNSQLQVDYLIAKPWERDVHHFAHIKISALALLKMVMHARSGGTIEVMGLVVGKIGGPSGNILIVMDCFALPVEGTETRVNAQSEAYEYMVSYMEAATQVCRRETVIGWYHSHPGYGCWLSGIDVATEHLNQTYQEPFVAIVIDPVRTISSGKVNIGAFRTYPNNYICPEEGPSEYQSIPQDKIEDFGFHSKRYYALEISYFKSSLDKKIIDSLWNKFWINTLSSSPLLATTAHMPSLILDLSKKLENSHTVMQRTSVACAVNSPLEPHEVRMEDKLGQVVKDSCKLTIEALNGLMGQVIKDRLFNLKPQMQAKCQEEMQSVAEDKV